MVNATLRVRGITDEELEAVVALLRDTARGVSVEYWTSREPIADSKNNIAA